MSRDPIHVLVYGDAGSKKSTFAATFPAPILVFHFDPFGKDTPYLKRGNATPLRTGANDMREREVQDLAGACLIKLEYYHNVDATDPRAYHAFSQRLAHASDLEIYKTIVFDSVTFMTLAKRHEAQYKTMRTAKDPRRWYGEAKEALEEILMVRVSGMEQNVVVLAHISEEKDEVHGNFVYNPAVPGKLSKGLPSGYGEFYHAYVTTNDNTNTYLLQTQKNAQFNAMSMIGAPNPCAPRYKALWKSRTKGGDEE